MVAGQVLHVFVREVVVPVHLSLTRAFVIFCRILSEMQSLFRRKQQMITKNQTNTPYISEDSPFIISVVTGSMVFAASRTRECLYDKIVLIVFHRNGRRPGGDQAIHKLSLSATQFFCNWFCATMFPHITLSQAPFPQY